MNGCETPSKYRTCERNQPDYSIEKYKNCDSSLLQGNNIWIKFDISQFNLRKNTNLKTNMNR